MIYQYLNKNIVSLAVVCLLLAACSSQKVMQPPRDASGAYVYSAIQDFQVSAAEGDVPAYIHQEKNALAIDAALYKTGFASASMVFSGETGAYDLILNTLLETDGESTYQIRRNGLKIGEVQNPSTKEDYESHSFRLSTVNLLHGDKIEVRFAPHSNGVIPEGDEHAYARGRWTGMVLSPR